MLEAVGSTTALGELRVCAGTGKASGPFLYHTFLHWEKKRVDVLQ